MKTAKMLTILVVALGLVVCQAEVSEAAPVPMGTAFTYQGHLYDNNSVADGEYDFRFSLYADPCVGSPIGSDINKPNVDVIDGYFTVQLDFNSPSAFYGYAHWLEIGVRPGELSDPCAYTPLSPRQELTPTPYALYAKSTGSVPVPLSLTGSTMMPPDAIISATNTGDGYGVRGWSDMEAGVFGEGGSSGVEGFSTGGTGVRGVSDIGVGVEGWSGSGYAGYFYGDARFTGNLIVDANIGIGTTSPDEKLDVSGNININSVYKIGGDTVLSTSGTANTMVGIGAGANNTGISNTFLGFEAGRYNTTGDNNTFLGVDAGFKNTDGSDNTFLGAAAGHDNTTGNENTFLGRGAGFWNETGTGNVFIGNVAGFNEGGSNKLYIDNSSTSTPLIYGDFSTNRVGIARVPTANAFEVKGNASKTTAGDWLANSDARIKTDVETITDALGTLDKVRLVSFRYNDNYRERHSSIEDRRYMNVVAQEFRAVFPEYVKSSGEKLPDGDEILQVDSYPLTVYSAAAVQELHSIVKAKDAEISGLKERISRIETVLAKLAHEKEGGQR